MHKYLQENKNRPNSGFFTICIGIGMNMIIIVKRSASTIKWSSYLFNLMSLR